MAKAKAKVRVGGPDLLGESGHRGTRYGCRRKAPARWEPAEEGLTWVATVAGVSWGDYVHSVRFVVVRSGRFPWYSDMPKTAENDDNQMVRLMEMRTGLCEKQCGSGHFRLAMQN